MDEMIAFGSKGPALASGVCVHAGTPVTCTHCPQMIRGGERKAELPSGGWAHVPCVGRATAATGKRAHATARDVLGSARSLAPAKPKVPDGR